MQIVLRGNFILVHFLPDKEDGRRSANTGTIHNSRLPTKYLETTRKSKEVMHHTKIWKKHAFFFARLHNVSDLQMEDGGKSALKQQQDQKYTGYA